MNDAFDPYRDWLGIDPRDLPADHYRLLGVARFTADPATIAAAADGRMAQVRSFQHGPQGRHTQKLLNEIANARVLLLNPSTKAVYDSMLHGIAAATMTTEPEVPIYPGYAPQSGIPSSLLPQRGDELLPPGSGGARAATHGATAPANSATAESAFPSFGDGAAEGGFSFSPATGSAASRSRVKKKSEKPEGSVEGDTDELLPDEKPFYKQTWFFAAAAGGVFALYLLIYFLMGGFSGTTAEDQQVATGGKSGSRNKAPVVPNDPNSDTRQNEKGEVLFTTDNGTPVPGGHSWTFHLSKPGTYKIEATYAGGSDANDVLYKVTIVNRNTNETAEAFFPVYDTGGLSNFQTFETKFILLKRNGDFTLTIAPDGLKPGRSPVKIRSLRLFEKLKSGTVRESK